MGDKALRAISYIFHPLLMPSLGMLLIFNSGTYLDLLDPRVKQTILLVIALGTCVFPLLMLPVLYQRRLFTAPGGQKGEGRMLMYLVVGVLYVITMVYFLRLPFSRVVHAYVIASVVVLMLLFATSKWIRICAHSAALGGNIALVVSLMLLFESPMQWILILMILASGITGTARLWTGQQQAREIFLGFLGGFSGVLGVMLLY